MTFRKLFFLSLVALLSSIQAIMAGPRSRNDMMAAAQAAIQVSGKANSPVHNQREIKFLLDKGHVALIGYTDGPYAVVTADDNFPAVVGVSETSYSGGENRNFEFWLNAMTAALAYRAENGMPAHIITPDPTVYPPSSGPLCTSYWDQLSPYNNLLPTGIYTGCVATAMAQVLYYHKSPEHGAGSRTIYAKGTPITANFEDDYYDWDNMQDTYTSNSTGVAADAVALLMRDCGVAANMEYGNAFDGGSGAYSQDAADGLRTYLNMPNAQCKERNNFSNAEWMDMVFNELAFVGPLYYGGNDALSWMGGGHAFVLHGYREDGMVYVNWGWSGEDDGWFDISLLNPPGYQFSTYQDMIIGIEGSGTKATIHDTLHVEQAGLLADALSQIVPADSLELIAGLKVIGDINSTDLRLLRLLAGCDDEMNLFRGSLRRLDLSEAHIVGGGEPYIKTGGRQLTTQANRIPELAFYGCRSLRTLLLPTDVVGIGKGAFALCSSIDTLSIPVDGNQLDYLVDGNTLYLKKDTNTVYAVLPMARGDYMIPKGKTAIGDYAFASAGRLSKIHVPSSVTSIGKGAFLNCSVLNEIRLVCKEVPVTASDALDGVKFTLTNLYVPAGSKDRYKYDPTWGQFVVGNTDHIMEFGSAITARNAGRDYGEENPVFGYSFSGDRPNGTPEIVCEATPDSPVGEYVIHVNPGTITDEVVDYYDGILKVWPARLKVSVPDYERLEGKENPEFEVIYEGFKLDETPEVLIKQPIATTTATIDSPAGVYPIVVSGGEAQNYEFRYIAGTLTVIEDTSGINDLTVKQQPFDVYTLDGVLVRSQIRQMTDLPKGIYVVNGQKYIVK